MPESGLVVLVKSLDENAMHSLITVERVGEENKLGEEGTVACSRVGATPLLPFYQNQSYLY